VDLKKRLAQLDNLTRKTASPTRNTSAAVKKSDNHSGAAAVEAVLAELGLQRQETPAGPLWCVDHRDRLQRPPDPVPDLTGLFTRQADRRPPLAEILLLDTETTGLAGGTGTLVFQLGVSWWESACLHTRQYFLPGPGHELALLTALAELAARFTVVVTFNGAAFDLPLLRTRALLNRLPDPLAHLVSWDVLVPARRLWGNRLPDCRQKTIEQAVCGGGRDSGDIDGARIPQTWFDFLATGEPGLLPQVLTHNHRDMVGMSEILAHVCRAGQWLGVAGGAGRSWPDDARWHGRAGAWALGRICERRLEPEAAAWCFAQAWACAWDDVVEPDRRRRFRRDAIRNLKRRRHWDLVEDVIGDGLESEPDDAGLHREAAILYEHRLIDLARALQHAIRAGDDHRTARLERLLAKPTGCDR